MTEMRIKITQWEEMAQVLETVEFHVLKNTIMEIMGKILKVKNSCVQPGEGEYEEDGYMTRESEMNP